MPPLDEIDVPGGTQGQGTQGGAAATGSPTRAGTLKSGDVVTGTVVLIDSDGVLVDVGAKDRGFGSHE